MDTIGVCRRCRASDIGWFECKNGQGSGEPSLGAFYVTVVIFAFTRLGPALTFGLIVAGQMAIALFLDHFNVLVAQQHSINFWRIIGVVLILAGVVIIRKF